MHDRIPDLYESTARQWDETRRQTLLERSWLDRFAALLPSEGSILDLGCGGGDPVARYLIGQGFAITGLDTSPTLIGLARERFPTASWHVGDMRELTLGRTFDGILAWHSFFHLCADDQRAMFPRFAAHAHPGTILMFTSGPMEGERIGEWQGEPLYHASLAPDEYRDLLDENGFQLVSFTPGEPVEEGPSVWIARQMRPASGLDGSA